MRNHAERRRLIALAWADAQDKVARRVITPGAFSLLHQLAWLIGRWGEDGGLEMPERWIAQRLGMDPKTYRKRRRELEAAKLVRYEVRRRRGTAVFGRVVLPFLEPTAGENPAATEGENPAATEGENPAVTAGKNPAVLLKALPLRGNKGRVPQDIETVPFGDGFSSKSSKAEKRSGEHLSSSLSGHQKRETHLMGQLRDLIGDSGMRDFGGLWRQRIRRNPAVVESCIAEVRLMRREGKPIDSIGGTLNWLWKEWSKENASSPPKAEP